MQMYLKILYHPASKLQVRVSSIIEIINYKLLGTKTGIFGAVWIR